MNYMEEARDELKRADHLIYVSLKYTRTCDTMKNIIHRLINAYDFAITTALKKSKEDKKISSIPTSKIKRAETILKLKRNIKDYIKNYFLLIDLDKSEINREGEYRKNVTLISKVSEGNIIRTNVPDLMDHFEKTKDFVSLMGEWI